MSAFFIDGTPQQGDQSSLTGYNAVDALEEL